MNEKCGVGSKDGEHCVTPLVLKASAVINILDTIILHLKDVYPVFHQLVSNTAFYKCWLMDTKYFCIRTTILKKSILYISMIKRIPLVR